ncbi:unnamed protein product [Sympodiomycopsis kandeliae]
MSFLRATRGASSSKRQLLSTSQSISSVKRDISFQATKKTTTHRSSSGKMSPPSSRSAQIAKHLDPRKSMSTSTLAHAGNVQAVAAAPGLPKPHDGGGPMKDEPKVLFRANNSAHEIVLNRETAINALDLDMIKGIAGALQRSSHSPQASCIILRASQGSRGLCSGGDVLQVVDAASSEDPATRQKALQFFQEEFELDWRIARLGDEVVNESNRQARSVVALMDGITMGGGVGLSVHAPFRVATETTRFAMPETGIGYFPDVGVTRVLARLDGRVGTYLGMTGDHITGEEAYLAGLATHFVPSTSLPALVDALSSLPVGATPQNIATCIDDFCVDPLDAESGYNPKTSQITQESPLLADKRVVLDYVFAQPSVEAVFTALEDLIKPTDEEASHSQAGQELRQVLGLKAITADIRHWASKTYKNLSQKSPRSLKITHQAINYEARRFDIDESFRFDMRLATVFCDMGVGRDFYTGVHHVLTKDPETNKRRTGRAPWSPSQLQDVQDTQLRDLFFGPLETAKEAGLALKPPTLNIPDTTRDRAALQARDQQLRGLGPLGWETSFNAYHPLPSEAELEALLHGSHPSAGSLAIDLSESSSVQEIAEALRHTRGGRRGQAWGLEKKVEDWRQRRLSATKNN